jgi:hypothetical protein
MSDTPDVNPQDPAQENFAGASGPKVTGNGALPEETVTEVDDAVFADTETETIETQEDDRIAEVEAALALDDEEGVGLATPQSLLVSIGKPPDFFMAHPDPAMGQIVSGVFGPGIGKPFYLVGANARGYLSDFMRRVQLQLCIDQDDNEFLWPIKLPSTPGADLNVWSASSLEAVNKARAIFYKLVWVEGQQGYKALPIDGAHVSPHWSGRTFAQIRNAGLRDFVINDKTHPVAKWLRQGKVNTRRGR